MPTLIFRFKTNGKQEKRKYSQMKLRFNYQTNEITEEMINKLRSKLIELSNLTYMSGQLPCVYIGKNRLFKTTIFSNSKETVIELLKQLMPLTNTTFIEKIFHLQKIQKEIMV